MYIRIHMYIHIHTYIHIHMYIHIQMYLHIYICIYIYTYVYTYTHVHMLIYAYVHLFAPMYIGVSVRIYVYIHIPPTQYHTFDTSRGLGLTAALATSVGPETIRKPTLASCGWEFRAGVIGMQHLQKSRSKVEYHTS